MLLQPLIAIQFKSLRQMRRVEIPTDHKRDVVGNRGLQLFNQKTTIIKQWKGQKLKKKDKSQQHQDLAPQKREREKESSRQKKEHQKQIKEQKAKKRDVQKQSKEEKEQTQEHRQPKKEASEQVNEKQNQIKTLSDVVMPLLYQLTTKAAQFAANFAYDAVKNGFLWLCNQFAENVIPYAVENLPKILFVTKKQEKPLNFNSSTFQVLDVEEKDYDQIPRRKEGKTRVVIPLGTENDSHFIDYLQKQNYKIKEEIDLESEDSIHQKQGLMIPSESFQVILQETKQSYQQLQQDTTHNKEVIRLQNCFIFELQGKNSIEYDMLDTIEKHEKTKQGYIIVPEQTLKRSVYKGKKDVAAEPETEKLEKKQIKVQQKKVDLAKNVHVETENTKRHIQGELVLN